MSAFLEIFIHHVRCFVLSVSTYLKNSQSLETENESVMECLLSRGHDMDTGSEYKAKWSLSRSVIIMTNL